MVLNGEDFNEMVRSYLACAIWADLGEEFSDVGVGVTDIQVDSVLDAVADCFDFVNNNSGIVDETLAYMSPGDLGHNFWLSRKGHGTGFFDADIPKLVANRMQSLAQEFSESVYVYLDDNKKVVIE